MTAQLLDAARRDGLAPGIDPPLMIGGGDHGPVPVQHLDVGDDQIVGAAHSRVSWRASPSVSSSTSSGIDWWAMRKSTTSCRYSILPVTS